MKRLCYLLIRALMAILNKAYGVDENKIIFTSFGGRSYSDNTKAISVKLNDIAPEFKQVWLFRNVKEKKNIIPPYIKPVKLFSLRSVFEQATAKIWVDNFAKPGWVRKSKNQVYIQTYHADRGFKKINLHASKNNNKTYLESKACDLMLSGSTYFEEYHVTSFAYSGPVLKYGSPRCDILIENDDNKRMILKSKLGIDISIKILLYAPTFRKESKEKEILNKKELNAIIAKLESTTGEKWICLLRSHVLLCCFDKKIKNKNIIDVSEYDDMADLLLISDMLITDYSSCAGDFILRDKPIILYHNNQNNYITKERSLYFSVNKSPYIIAKNLKSILQIIEKSNEIFEDNCEKLKEFYGVYESGHAALKVAEYIKYNGLYHND